MSKLALFTNDELQIIVNQSSSGRQFLKKIGYKSNSGDLQKAIVDELSERGINVDSFKIRARERKARVLTENDVFRENSDVNQSVLRKYTLNGGFLEYKCALCGLGPEWNGMPLSLTLDHIDGNCNNNVKGNLRWVCPNCDRQLPTFAGRNRKKTPKHYCIECGKQITNYAVRCKSCANRASSKKRKVTLYKILWPERSVLVDMIRKTNYEQVGRELGVSGNAVRKHIRNSVL